MSSKSQSVLSLGEWCNQKVNFSGHVTTYTKHVILHIFYASFSNIFTTLKHLFMVTMANVAIEWVKAD